VRKVLRAAAHVHSEWSDDAGWSLDAIARSFRRRRYDVVLMCEHSRGWTAHRYDEYIQACEAASQNGVLLVPGIEYEDEDNVVHVAVWGRLPFFGPAPDIGQLLRKVAAVDGISVLAHPWRRQAWRRFKRSWAEHLTAIEIWNRKYDGWAPNRSAVEMVRHEQLGEFVSLDFHTRRQFFPLAMALRVDSDARAERDTVYSALRAGAFECRAFSRPAQHLTQGVRLGGLEACERLRRPVAGQLRRITG
jgi:predicted metal-dependent phosphoesterase TrpH